MRLSDKNRKILWARSGKRLFFFAQLIKSAYLRQNLNHPVRGGKKG
jgi:hypothetical protein